MKHVIADLTDATFVDSTAVGALLAASAQIRDSGGRLTLICTNKNVLRTVEIAACIDTSRQNPGSEDSQ